MPVIDFHAHYCPREYYGILESRKSAPYVKPADNQCLLLHYGNGRESYIRREMYSLPDRIHLMDSSGIDLQVLSPLLHGVHGLDPKTGLELCRAANDGVADAAERHKGRFVGLAALPLQGADEAMQELERSIHDLGLKGVIFLSNIEGRFLDEPTLWPLYERIARLGVPIFLHPTYPVNDKGMKDLGLISALGFLYDTTLAMLRIIFSGLLERYPGLTIVLPHLGSVIPYIAARIDKERFRPGSSTEKIQRPPSDYFKLVYVDTVSLHPPALMMAHGYLGPDRMLFGSDYPFWGVEENLDAILGLDIPLEDKEKVLSGNAKNLLRLA